MISISASLIVRFPQLMSEVARRKGEYRQYVPGFSAGRSFELDCILFYYCIT